MGGQLAPQHGEALHIGGVVHHLLLVNGLGVDVDLHGQLAGQHGVDGVIEARGEVGVQAVVVVGLALQRRRVDAEAHAVEAQLRHQRDVAVVGVAIGKRGGIVVGMLREPLRSVDAVAQMLGAREGGAQLRRAILRKEDRPSPATETKKGSNAERTHERELPGLNWTTVHCTTTKAEIEVGQRSEANTLSGDQESLPETRDRHRTGRSRHAGGAGWASGVRQDLHFAARQFRRAPGYVAFTVLVLALGIGTVTAMFTISYAVLLKPLPFKADGRLFQPVEKTAAAEEELTVSAPEMKEWQHAVLNRSEVAFTSGGLNIADGPGGAVLITEVDASGKSV